MNDDLMTSTSTTNDTEWSKNCCWPSQIEYLLMMLLLVLLWSGGSSAVTTTMILWAMRMMISMPLSIALCTQHSLFSTQCSSKLKLSAGLSLLYSSYPWTHGIALTTPIPMVLCPLFSSVSSSLVHLQAADDGPHMWWLQYPTISIITLTPYGDLSPLHSFWWYQVSAVSAEE